MLEGLVTWILNNYLGKYIENLNTDQLSIALLSGEVELENLPLKKNAFYNLGIPIRVQAGFVGKIKLQIPLRQIRSAPWVIVIEQLYLVATPINLSEWNSEMEENITQECKLNILDALEAQWRAETETHPEGSYYASSFSSWMSYGTGLVTNIIENLQLKIKDVHLRYEDRITCGEGNSFACGLIMESFSAESCDSDWQRTFTNFSQNQYAGCSFKLLELQNMAFYWDQLSPTNDKLADLSLGDLAVQMSNLLKVDSHQFILSPVSALAHLKRERCEQPLRSRSHPRFTCQLSLEEVAILLSDKQYNQTIGCFHGLTTIERIRVFRQRRPNTAISKNPKAWWTYAVKCYFSDYNFMDPKPTWETCLSRAKECIEYVDLYSTLLKTPSITLSAEKKLFKDKMEWALPFEQLKLLRESAMRRVPFAQNFSDQTDLMNNERAQSRSMLMRWFPQWWGWYNETDSTDLNHLPYKTTSDSAPDLEGEILDVIADSIENNTLLKRDAVFGLFEFLLPKGSLQICSAINTEKMNTSNKAILELHFENVGFSLITRPRTSSHTISVTLGSIYLKDHLTENSLFPILISSQGKIREGLCNLRFSSVPPFVMKPILSNTNIVQMANPNDSLFQLIYERKPINMNCDYRLYVKSQSLEIVYNPLAVKWLVDFLTFPFSVNNDKLSNLPERTNAAYSHVKHTTKMHLMTHWENILQGELAERSSWNLELDISAPQFFLIENFTDRNSLLAVLDFGKLHLSNYNQIQVMEQEEVDDDENEMFMTPCSTPPASEVSDFNLTDCGTSPIPPDTPQLQPNISLNQDALYHKLYYRYRVELSELQILIGKIKDNWKFSNIKGTSSLHIVDRFNILLQIERRVIYTSDPQFPSVTLCGSLPNLIVHINEHKLHYIQSLLAVLNVPTQNTKDDNMPVPINEDWKITPPVGETVEEYSEVDNTERSSNQLSRLLMVQFSIDQLALEVQSRGRSVAEIQVCGVKAIFTKRIYDFNLSLSVHSFLLVDALQTYGPDFELLIASHKHVGMDSVSGSIKDSEPTSPVSPSSPPDNIHRHPPPPAALSQALNSLNIKDKSTHICISPSGDAINVPVIGIMDSEALIVVELTIVSANCPSNQNEELIIANILFNNLDIIANQETIVELLGFVKRITSNSHSKSSMSDLSMDNSIDRDEPDSPKSAEAALHKISIRNEITFDFHRLSVLLLRGSVEEGVVIGKKIATATMSNAKIQATLSDDNLELTGSLGGLQVVSLCAGTTVHQKILSVGHDPLINQDLSQPVDYILSLSQEIYKGIENKNLHQKEEKAFSFKIIKSFDPGPNKNPDSKDELNVDICLRMASVWYIHSAIFISEVQSCVTEFKQYLSNLARSIKIAATDMAIGLVNPRSESLSSSRITGSTEWISPRRPRSISIGYQEYDDFETSEPNLILNLDVLLETPVVVLPRSPTSCEVFVAHLGNISLTNQSGSTQQYSIKVRDINIYSLDVASRLNVSIGDTSVDTIYECGSYGKPILHDTTIHFDVEKYEINNDPSCEHLIQINGKVVTPLKISSTRQQYEQLLETISSLSIPSPIHHAAEQTSSYNTDSTGIVTLNMDPQIRAQIINTFAVKPTPTQTSQHIKVYYELPIFTIDLIGDFGKGEQSLVNLSFRDFIVKYEKCHSHETNIEMSLRSITMEDLGDIDGKYRFMMSSHKLLTPKSDFVSHSNPDLSNCDLSSTSIETLSANSQRRNSLPHKFIIKNSLESFVNRKSKAKQSTFSMPQDNLVLISMKIINPEHPFFSEKYNNVRKQTKINFNCLDLIMSIDSWVVVLDFFGIGSDSNSSGDEKSELIKSETKQQQNKLDSGETEMEVTIQSLNVILLRPQYEVCRANISRLDVLMKDKNNDGNDGGRQITGTLGSMSLIDLSPHGNIWKEKFLSSETEALKFQYDRFAANDPVRAQYDTKLSIKMSSIVFIHTKRFLGEVQAYFRDFSQLQSVLSQARQKVSVTANSKFTRMKISIKCLSPAILIPVSSSNSSLLVAEIGKLTVDNEFKISGSKGTISTIRDAEITVRELLDVMTIHIENMNLYCGEKHNLSSFASNGIQNKTKHMNCHEYGPTTIIYRKGPFLLTEKCDLTLQVEKNLESFHNVADMSIQGTLNTLNGSIDLQQYKVIKGLLSFNLGENIDDLALTPNIPIYTSNSEEKVWTLTSIQFDLLNVILRLETEHNVSSLACINFIKSRLLVESFSDMTQDIDLVSQEILLSDVRYESDPVNKRCNVFSSIVIPMGLKMGDKNQHSVQAEVHARKRKEHSAYTILVNSMRLMAIIDWWQAVHEFIMSPPTGENKNIVMRYPILPQTEMDSALNMRQSPAIENQFDLKINITDSQIVFVEDTSQWDTNAVILKSTIVITYKPGSEPKPLSCVLNHCEVFSCILGMEEETALSIIDPITLQIDLTSTKILKVQSPQLSIRLSYHDVCMLIKMFQSLPQQTMGARAANSSSILPVNKNRESIQRLHDMGFTILDCELALLNSNYNLEQAAFWLTENAKITNIHNHVSHNDSQSVELFQIKADCISICIIDDCRDSDVPVLELSLSEMILLQDVRFNTNNIYIHESQSPPLCLSPDTEPNVKTNENGPGSGRLQCKLASDYYNRALSGWEPFIEPWSCDASWEYGLTNIQRKRFQLELNSTELLNINITSTLIELYNVVKDNWTQDYYSLPNRSESSPKLSPPGYRRRSPFIPFALRNLSGCKLWFTTIVTTADIISENIQLSDPDETWIEVSSEDIVPFKFGERGKRRHRDSHKLRLHQLGVRIDGWNSISPVCVDKVGVFFRHITHTESDVEARLVFSITLEGSARKLITVRSALQLVNHLPITIEVRADNIANKPSGTMWSNISPPKPVFINTGDTWCVPLSHNPTPMWVRPISNHHSVSSPITPPSYLYCAQPIDWRLATRQAPEDCLQIPHVCHSNSLSSYRFCCILRRETFPMERGIPQPGHTMILKSPVRIINLLPVELNFGVGSYDHEVNRIAPGQTARLSQVDVQKNIEISVYLEGFPGVAMLIISPNVTESFSSRLRLSDTSGRKLTLNAYVSIKRSDTIKVSISAPYWIINRTGVPIVFRQEGVPTETAGQFEEHEIARMVAPLLFSFTDCDGSSTVVARVGSGVIQNGNPLWCSPFGLSPGMMVRRLIVSNISAIAGNERILLVGIAIRPGRGRYRHTNICTISPRFQIHNNTSFHLQFSQKCYAKTIVVPEALSTYINTTPKCSIPFHWPNHDQELLLCVKIMNIPNCNWSGGFQIDTNHSLHVNIRDSNASSYFLRLEVILQGATYFIVFTDADTMPPPIRIDNYAHVHLHFLQIGCKEESLIKAHSSKPWALIEPCGTAILAIRAPGGTRTTINLQKLDEAKQLTYQNFIYIAFTGTHLGNNTRGNGIEDTQLVLEVSSGPSSSGIVFLAKKRDGERAQLWRLNKNGHLLHEGSSPPQPANAPPDVNAPHALVLDIESSAPQPSTMAGLCVRRVHPRRSSTQTWHFTPNGQLSCAHNNMIVQPLDGFFGLREGNRAVLGLPGPPGPHILSNGIPIEHAVSSQTLRPGSGSLEVTVTTDGPTRVIKIIDTKQRNDSLESVSCENDEVEINNKEIQLRVAVGGVGLSLVSRSPSQELVFCLFSGVLLESVWSSSNQKLNLSVQDIQIDNQLLGTSCPVLLHTIKNRSGSYDGQGASLPAIHLSTERTASPPTTRYNAHIFKHFIISLRPISIHLEERLLLKLCLWSGIGVSEDSFNNEEPDETDFETQRILTEITAVHAKRYYFGVLKLIPNQIRLSMQTVSKLPPTLAAIKKRLGLKLIKFEDAGVELEPFIRWHPFETSQFLWHSIVKHYKDELKWQAAIILGSVDFLGNPLGFVQDVSDGVSGLIYEGSVGTLVKNVAHGISNSAAKVTESLGDGIGRVILDEAHEETRARIRGIGESGGTSHLVAGLRGLGLGLLGGMTSLVKHTYEGATHQGLPGFFTGVGRGLIGTVTKPVVGVLDLAAETAAAVRDTSRRSDRWIPERSRPPRSPMGPGGLLPRYSYTQSVGHQYLYSINGRDYEEGFLAYECIRGQSSDIRALISTRFFRVFTCTSGEPNIVIETHLSNLIGCQAVTNDLGENYIELTVKVDSAGGLGVRRPQVQCDTPELSRWVSHQVNYAKCMFHEKLFTLQVADVD